MTCEYILMRTIVFRTRFKKEYKKCRARGLNMSLYKKVIECLVSDISLTRSHRPHQLGGRYQDLWECHITSDWLLIYYPDNENNLVLYRMGTHADLF